MYTFESDAEYLEYIQRNVTYEWVTEVVDEYEDIIDTYVVDSPLEGFSAIPPADHYIQVALRRIWGSSAEGELERGYAYINDGEIEPFFDCGHKVPKQFYHELQKAMILAA